MRALLLAVLLFPGAQERARLPEQIEDLIGRGRSAPSEFAADALLQIAESGRVADRGRRIELIEEAFRFAGGAQQPLRLQGLDSSGDAESREDHLSRAFDLELDALSLRSRAIRAMLKLDRARALGLFREMPAPRPAPLSCKQALVPWVDPFYQTLAEIVKNAYSPEEVRNQSHVRLLEAHVVAITSPAQVTPTAKAILAVETTASQFEALARAFAASLERIAGDDRSFAFFMAPPRGDRTTESIGAQVEKLVAAGRAKGIPAYGLLQAYRTFLVNHLTGNRCADNAEAAEKGLSAGDQVERFNSMLRRAGDSSAAGIAPVVAGEIRPAKIEAGAKPTLFWQTPESRKLLAMVEKLAEGFLQGERDDAEWQSDLNRFLSELEAWKTTHELSEADYFHQKAEMLRGLAWMLRQGRRRDEAFRSYVAFLGQSPIQHENRIEWFLHARLLLDSVHASGRERGETLDALATSRNAVLLLYLDLERLLQ